MPSHNAFDRFRLSTLDPDIEKPCVRQMSRRTAARVSAKVGRCLRYQAAVETAKRACLVTRVSVVHGSACSIGSRPAVGERTVS
jgi:hypothetical protein